MIPIESMKVVDIIGMIATYLVGVGFAYILVRFLIEWRVRVRGYRRIVIVPPTDPWTKEYYADRMTDKERREMEEMEKRMQEASDKRNGRVYDTDAE